MLNNILKYKTLIKNIFLKTLPLLVWLNISYSVNNLNTQLKKQIIEMEQQSQLILTLQEEVFDLKKRNYTKRSTRDCKSIISS